VTQEQFDQLAITPQLLDAFFILRYQTGAWVEGDHSQRVGPGEGGRAGAAGEAVPH
jgi:hypothetical protein